MFGLPTPGSLRLALTCALVAGLGAFVGCGGRVRESCDQLGTCSAPPQCTTADCVAPYTGSGGVNGATAPRAGASGVINTPGTGGRASTGGWTGAGGWMSTGGARGSGGMSGNADAATPWDASTPGTGVIGTGAYGGWAGGFDAAADAGPCELLGTWRSISAPWRNLPGAAVVTFASDGTFTGVPQFSGTYLFDGSTLSILTSVGVDMTCDQRAQWRARFAPDCRSAVLDPGGDNCTGARRYFYSNMSLSRP
jgi:hypothetical protein